MANETDLTDHSLATRDPEVQEDYRDNAFRRMHGKALGHRDEDELCRGLVLFATELGIPHDLPVPPKGLPGVWSRKPSAEVMEIIRLAAHYPVAMANGESRTLWNIHDEIAAILSQSFINGCRVIEQEQEEKQAQEVRARWEKTDTRKAESFVYFIAAAGGPVKIGMAMDVQKRLASLQTAHHERLEVLATATGGAKQERAYHKKFAKHRLEGEWFEPYPDILAEIVRLTTPPTE